MKLASAVLLLAATCFGNGPAPEVKAEAGDIDGSSYRIDMPANYNGNLVVYCHGYGGNVKFDTRPNNMLKVFTDAGYAVAQAGYSGGGWAVEQAITDTEKLRRFFLNKYGKPKHTYVTGHSMGGLITVALIEKFPEAYDGALPMCGVIAPTITTFKRRLFDLLVVFDYYYPGVIGSPVQLADNVRLTSEYTAELARIIDADPVKRAAVAKYAGLQSPEKETAPGIAFFANILKELQQRAGGNAFDNRDTIYSGTENDVLINRQVKRYAADPKAVEYVKRYYSSTGKLTRPVLAVHSYYDPVVPTWVTNEYGDMVRLNGAADLFVQRFTAHGGHCAIQPQETIHAFTDLIDWVTNGKRPAPGEQR